MLAFLNDPKVKNKYVRRVRGHQKADEIIKGDYWTDGRGCAVGCTIHGRNHQSYETELGIPQEIAWLEDGIFENLPLEKAKQWPLDFLKAIKVGSDLSRIHYKFLEWLLSEETGILKFDDENRAAILAIRDLHRQAGNGIPQSQPQSQPQGQPQGQPQSQPHGQPHGQPQSQPQGQPQSQPQGQPQGQPQSQPHGQPQSQPHG